MLDVLSYNEGSRKSIYFGLQLKLTKLLTRVVPARIIIISSNNIIIRDSLNGLYAIRLKALIIIIIIPIFKEVLV